MSFVIEEAREQTRNGLKAVFGDAEIVFDYYPNRLTPEFSAVLSDETARWQTSRFTSPC